MQSRQCLLQSVEQIKADYVKLQVEYNALATQNDAALATAKEHEADLAAAQQMETHCEGLAQHINKLKRDAESAEPRGAGERDPEEQPRRAGLDAHGQQAQRDDERERVPKCRIAQTRRSIPSTASSRATL